MICESARPRFVRKSTQVKRFKDLEVPASARSATGYVTTGLGRNLERIRLCCWDKCREADSFQVAVTTCFSRSEAFLQIVPLPQPCVGDRRLSKSLEVPF